MTSTQCTAKAAQQRHPRVLARMVALNVSVKMLGAQADLASALGIDPRTLRAKLTAERGITNADLRAAVTALEARASQVLGHAAKLRAEIDL